VIAHFQKVTGFEGLDTPTTKVWPNATDIERKIIDAIHTKALSVSQIAALTPFSKTTIRKNLKSLEEKAYIKKSESQLKGNPFVYRTIIPRSARKRRKIPKHVDTHFKRLKITPRKIEATCPPGTTIQLKELKSGIQLFCKVMD
jgi:predicted transcriptional regulator